MKRSKRSVVITLFLFCLTTSGCKKRSPVETYVQDGEVNEGQVVSAVERQLATLADGLKDNDADRIFSIFSKAHVPTYVRDGKLEEIDVARESYRRALGKLEKQREFSFEQKQFDVLSRSSVLFTGLGTLKTEGAPPWKIAYTILWTLEPDGWKALNMHISWPNEKTSTRAGGAGDAMKETAQPAGSARSDEAGSD